MATMNPVIAYGLTERLKHAIVGNAEGMLKGNFVEANRKALNHETDN